MTVKTIIHIEGAKREYTVAEVSQACKVTRQHVYRVLQQMGSPVSGKVTATQLKLLFAHFFGEKFKINFVFDYSACARR